MPQKILRHTGAFCYFVLILVQATLGQGLILNDSVYNALPRMPNYNEGSKAENDLLKNLPKLDLRPYCPTPQNQGAIGSCTGWSTGYGALSILNAVQQKWAGKRDTITKNAFSALFIYNQVKSGSCDAGAPIDKAADLLRNKGDVLSNEFDKFKNNCERQPTPAELEKASRMRIKDFVTLFSTSDPARVRIEKTKISLAQHLPVVIGMLLRKNFEHIRPGDTYWYPDNGDTTFAGAHAMVVVGYDDAKEAFEIMNSWGPVWGNGGFIWVKYKDYARFCCYGYQFVPYEDPASQIVYNARVQLRKPVYDESDSLYFNPVNLVLKEKYYDINPPVLQRNDLLQLFVPQVTAGMYLYAFSYGTKRNINVHWPRDAKLDSRFDGINESAILAFSNIRLAIPDTYGALQFSDPGTEYLCLLFSKEPMPNINAQLQQLQKLPAADFFKNLYTAFGADLMPQKEVQYEPDVPGFTNPIKKGMAVPVVFRVKVGS